MESYPTPTDWRSWLAECAPRYLLFARHQCRSVADAEDVLQEALVEAWQRADGMPDDALVYATIRRRAIDLGRRADRREQRELQSGEPEEPWFEPEIESRETDQLLEGAVKALDPKFREVVTLKIWGGLTFQEIADTLGVPLNTAASRYRYALEELRRTLRNVEI